MKSVKFPWDLYWENKHTGLYTLHSKRFQWIYWLKAGTRVPWLAPEVCRWNKTVLTVTYREFNKKKITSGTQGRTTAKQNKPKRNKKMDKRGRWEGSPLSPSSSFYFALVNLLDRLARKCLLCRYPGPIDFLRNFSPLERLALFHGEKIFKKNLCLQWKSFLLLDRFIVVCILRLIVLPSYEDRTTRYLAYITLDKVKTVKSSFKHRRRRRQRKLHFKHELPFFRTFPRLFQFAWNVKCGRISLELISWGTLSSLERERKFCRRLFTSSIKREIRHFHVVVCSDDREMYK